MMRNPPRWSPQPPPPNRPLPTGWRALLIGLAFGFSAGFLFTIGIIALTSANNTTEIPPVGNGAISASATPAPTSAPTPTPTFTATPTPTFTPTPSPTPTPTPGGSDQILRPDDPLFYIIVLIAFLVLSAFLLLRKK